MIFRDWIENYGKKRLAQDIGHTVESIDHWLRGKGTPKTHVMYRLLKMSKGALTFEAVYKETSRNNPKHKVFRVKPTKAK